MASQSAGGRGAADVRPDKVGRSRGYGSGALGEGKAAATLPAAGQGARVRRGECAQARGDREGRG